MGLLSPIREDAVKLTRLMRGYPAARPLFGSLRLRPFGDGLAWLVGLAARRRLKRLAAFDTP